jgi:hypothetical protein
VDFTINIILIINCAARGVIYAPRYGMIYNHKGMLQTEAHPTIVNHYYRSIPKFIAQATGLSVTNFIKIFGIIHPAIIILPEGLFTHKSTFALGLQFYNTNNILLYSKMN